MEITAGGRQDKVAVAVDEFGENPDAVLEPGLAQHIAFGEVVGRFDLAGIANAQGHAEVAQLGALAAGHEGFQRVDCMHRLLAADHFAMSQGIGIGAVEVKVAHVEISEIALFGNCAPGASHGLHAIRNKARLQRLLERLAQERGEHFVLLAAGLDLPLAANGPVGVSLRIGLHRIDEARLVDPAHRKHHRGRHHLSYRVLMGRRAAAMGNVGIAGRIDHPLGQNRFAPRLALDDHARDRLAFHDRCDEQAVQHGNDPRFLHKPVGDEFEAFGIERMADRLRFGHGGAHRLGALFEFAADAFAVDGCRVAIPGKAFDPDLGDIAAEAAVTLKQNRLDPSPRAGQRCCKPTWS